MNKEVHFWARVAVVPRINVFALAAKNVDGRTFCGEECRGKDKNSIAEIIDNARFFSR